MVLTLPSSLRFRRGMALVAAIAVLAILTILVVGLAASYNHAGHNSLRVEVRREVMTLSRSGLEAALALLARTQLPLQENLVVDYPVRERSCRIEARNVAPDDPVYDGRFLSHRAGDLSVTLTTAARKGRIGLRLEHLYLVNVDPARPRCLRLNERVTGYAPPGPDREDESDPPAASEQHGESQGKATAQ